MSELQDIAEEINAIANKASTIDEVLYEVEKELWSAMDLFPPMNSAHEGYGVLLEELDELWDEVKAKQSKRDVAAMRKEAIQVAAMAMRFIIDVCDSNRGQV